APNITSISPDPAREGFDVTITGSNFDPDPANNTVTLDGVVGTVNMATSTELNVTLPETVCLPARDDGQYVVTVA
ncbi:MAG: hypothetical protein GWN07_07860, partial [Actinobacteria bacterium]|nr:hypothetical protein [Actinomycetota bacterium]NIS30147.1 hypothetical protein [Actinomycetota bacterium]NIU65404.1 hypothetical protein [Actinomycetota bacterium]NIW27203.1 hypothetical protein [Actinomycetota bacterium]NIX19743.1 hypothetical protein [Actinomycetota bacterium]